MQTGVSRMVGKVERGFLELSIGIFLKEFSPSAEWEDSSDPSKFES